MTQFDNDDVIFKKFEDDPVTFGEATGPDGDDNFDDFQSAMKVAREMQAKGADEAYRSMCTVIGMKWIEQVMKYGELVAVKEEFHVINGRDAE